jgi:hypothetical protein
MKMRAAAASLLLLVATSATACGHCVEDRIAAVYDHALQQRTAAAKHRIAYFAVEGSVANNEAMRRGILAIVEALPGVIRGSARVSMEPSAIALAFDPARSSPQAIESALRNKLRPLKLRPVPLAT